MVGGDFHGFVVMMAILVVMCASHSQTVAICKGP